MIDFRGLIHSRRRVLVAGAVVTAFAVTGFVMSAGEYTADAQSDLMFDDELAAASAARTSRDQRAADTAHAAVSDMTVVQRPSTYTVTGRVSEGEDGYVLWMVIRAEGRYHSAWRVDVDADGRFTAPVPRRGSPPEFEVVLVRAVPLANVSSYLDAHPSATMPLPEDMVVASTLRILRQGDTSAEA